MFLLFIHCHYVLFYRTQQLYLTRNQYLCACSRGVRTADADIRGPRSADFLADADSPRTRQTNTFVDVDRPRISCLRTRIIRGREICGSAHLWHAVCPVRAVLGCSGFYFWCWPQILEKMLNILFFHFYRQKPGTGSQKIGSERVNQVTYGILVNALCLQLILVSGALPSNHTRTSNPNPTSPVSTLAPNPGYVTGIQRTVYCEAT